MSDRVTQIQDAVDRIATNEQLAQQLVTCIYFAHKRHSIAPLDDNDHVREAKPEEEHDVDPLPPDQFQAGLLELSRDLILKEQEVEVLISTLPGLSHSEADQHQQIRQLEDEIRQAEEARAQTMQRRDQVLQQVDHVLRSVQRPH